MERISLDLQREKIDELARAIAERRQSEASVRNSFEAREDTINSQFSEDRDRLNKGVHSEKYQLQSQHTSALESIARTYEEGVEQASAEHDLAYRETVKRAEARQQEARENYELARQTSELVYKDEIRDTAGGLQEFKHKIDQHRDELRNVEMDVQKVLRRRWCVRAALQLAVAQGSCDAAKPLERYGSDVAAARAARDQFQRQWTAQFVASGWLLAIFVFAWIALIALGAALSLVDWPWVIASCAVALGFTMIIYVALRQRVVRQTLQLYEQFRPHIANADKALDAARTLGVEAS